MSLMLENVSKTYTRNGLDVLALQQVSCSIEPGQFIAVCGPSGCGKSTLLQISGGLMRPDAGTVTLDDQDIYAWSADERAGFRGASVGFVFQQFHLVPYLNVLDNVLVASLALPAEPSLEPAAVEGEGGEERWFRVGIPALLRAGPSLSSLALERLEAGAVVKALQAAVEEHAAPVQVAPARRVE